MPDKYLQEISDRYSKLLAAANAVNETQKLLMVHMEAHPEYIFFRLPKKYVEGYQTAWKCLRKFLPLSPNDNTDGNSTQDRPS